MDKLEQLIYLQAGKCFFCGGEITPATANKEHLVPKSRGGSDSLDNLVACCNGTNSAFADIPLKDKIRLVLAQAATGGFKCFTPVLKAKNKSPASAQIDPASQVLTQIAARSNRPKTASKLGNVIKSELASKGLPVDPRACVQNLAKTGQIAIEPNGHVNYLH